MIKRGILRDVLIMKDCEISSCVDDYKGVKKYLPQYHFSRSSLARPPLTDVNCEKSLSEMQSQIERCYSFNRAKWSPFRGATTNYVPSELYTRTECSVTMQLVSTKFVS